MDLDLIKPRAGRGMSDITNRMLLCSPCNRKKRHKLTLFGLIEVNVKEEWMRDIKSAENAQRKVEDYVNKVNCGEINLRDGID